MQAMSAANANTLIVGVLHVILDWVLALGMTLQMIIVAK